MRSLLAACAVALSSFLSAQTLYTGGGQLVVPKSPTFGDPLPSQGCTQATHAPWSVTAGLPGGVASVWQPVSTDPYVGDFAANRFTEQVWVTNGASFAAYVVSTMGNDPQPDAVNAFAWPYPGLCRGLGSQAGPAGSETLWATDGTMIVGLLPPAVPGLPPGIGVAPFVPVALSPGASINDLDYDDSTDTLWIGESSGIVRQVEIGGAPGPFPPFTPDDLGTLTCGTSTSPLPIRGIAMDTCASTAGVIIVGCSSGTKRFLPTGVFAPPEIYGDSCLSSGVDLKGLAFLPRPIPLHTSTSAGQIGAFLAAGPGIVGTHTFAPGAIHILALGFTPVCPPLQITGTTLILRVDWTTGFLVGLDIPPPGAPAAVPLPYAGIPPNLSVFLQWFVIDANGDLKSSDAYQIVSSR